MFRQRFEQYFYGLSTFNSSEPEELKKQPVGVYINNEPLTVYKSVRCQFPETEWLMRGIECLCEMEIPKDSKIIVAEDREHYGLQKFRTNQALIKRIYSIDNRYKDSKLTRAFSEHDNDYTYEIGKMQEPEEEFSENKEKSCESGVHFFASEEEAKAWAEI